MEGCNSLLSIAAQKNFILPIQLVLQGPKITQPEEKYFGVNLFTARNREQCFNTSVEKMKFRITRQARETD